MRKSLNASRLITGALLLIMVGSLARSIEQARWTQGLDVLFPIAVIGVVAGVLLAASPLGTVRAHLVGVVGGILVVTWQTGSLLSPEALETGNRFAIVWSRFREWLSVVVQGGASYDDLLFVFTMGAIVWFLAYNSAWFVLRYGWVWWALLPTGLVMLVNLGYAIRPNTRPFVLFLLAAMLLMIHTHLTQKRARWEQDGLGYEGSLLPRFLVLGGVVSLFLLALAWQGPSASLARTARAVFARVEKPWEQVQNRWENAFAFLYPGSGRGRGGIGGGFTSFSDSFALGGPLRLGTRTVFTAKGEPRQYWRAIAYDRYTGHGWVLGDANEPSRPVAPLSGNQLDQRVAAKNLPEGVRRVGQQVTVVIPVGRNVFGADTPVQLDRPAEWQLTPLRHDETIPVEGKPIGPDVKDTRRAADLNSLRGLLRTIGPQWVRRASAEEAVVTPRPSPPESRTGRRATPSTADTPEEEDARRAEELLLAELRSLQQNGIDASYVYRKGKTPTIEYTYYEANQNDLRVVNAQEPVRKGETYEISSLVSNPTDEQLNAVKGTPPAWVRERYLDDDVVTPRVRELAREITRDARTTHEKAQAIESYLRQLKYKEDVPAAPPERNFVDYFLFDLREGYCTSFASAMVMMLRSIDIPARVVTGFAPGKWDQKLGEYVITEAQAHMWPQVYYPTYGWVNYEPTPIREPVNREPQISGPSFTDPSQIYGRTGPGRLADDLNQRQRRQRFGDQGSSSPLPMPVRFVLTAGVLLALLALAAYAVSLMRLRGLRGARRQYAKLLQVGSLLGVRPALSHTPSEYGVRLESALPRARNSVREITSRYVGEVFGRRRNEDASDLEGEWRTVATNAARTAPGRLGSTLWGLRGARLLGRLRGR